MRLTAANDAGVGSGRTGAGSGASGSGAADGSSLMMGRLGWEGRGGPKADGRALVRVMPLVLSPHSPLRGEDGAMGDAASCRDCSRGRSIRILLTDYWGTSFVPGRNDDTK